MTDLVYFVRAPSNGRIKIGFTTDLPARLATLRNASGESLELLAAVPGDMEYEADLHVQFADARLIGEWFEPCEGLTSLVSMLVPHSIDLGELAEHEAKRKHAGQKRTIEIRDETRPRIAAMLHELAEPPSRTKWIAERFGIDARTAKGWLGGDVPQGKHIIALCRYFGPSFTDFIINGAPARGGEKSDELALIITATRVRADLLEMEIKRERRGAREECGSGSHGE